MMENMASRKSTLLAKICLAVVLFTQSLVAISSDDANISLSGFVYNTTFSDNDWHDNRTVLSINGDFDYGVLAFRTQLSTTDVPVRRMVGEISYPFGEHVEMTYQVGRFSRLNSFYNSVLDSPSSYQMAMLPLSGYSYRMFNGSFSMMDGHNFITSVTTQYGIFKLRHARGSVVLDNQKDLQLEVLDRYDPNIEIVRNRESRDYGLFWETKSWQAYISRNYYEVEMETSSNLRSYKRLVDTYSKSEYTLDKVGIRYVGMDWKVSLESGTSNPKYVSRRGKTMAEAESTDYAGTVSYRIKDCTYIYSGYSYGKNRTANRKNTDAFVGITKNIFDKNLVFSLEYHRGKGESWVKYDSEGDFGNKHWNVIVLSTTYKF